ncbi:helix-turn-helix transcriptional regulator [Pseudomonas sp. GL-R-19]|uniref:helix-turn-helix transcriptional regulator n=1 Tax=Pseudomonas sp. GL-R-19 TaxID=2832391 RepID=UPI001CBC4159|nr:AraC family transcriptional regulator [Pseudomonas sp. GL-R-19]
MNPQSVISNHPCTLARPLGALSGWQERRAKELMLRDMGSCVRISEIAEHCNLSRSHFSRAFKKVTGHSPQGWLVMMKIEKAKSLLITSMPITDVVYECGFADHSHFTRTFSRLEGMTPKAWRRTFDHVASHPGQPPVIDRDIPEWIIRESLVDGVGQSRAQELHA